MNLVVVIKDLESVVQDRLHDSGLPSSIFDITPNTRPANVALLAHQSWPEAYCKIGRCHLVLLRMLCYPVKMQCEHSQSGIVGIRERVDDGMERVTAANVVIDLGRIDKRGVVCGSQERVRKISKEVLQKSRDRGDIMVECSRISEVN